MKTQIQKLILLSVTIIFLAINGMGQESTMPTIPNKTIQGWIFGDNNPIYNANPEITDGRITDILRPEYFTLLSNGTLEFINYSSYYNGYSEANADTVLNLQGTTINRPCFITISGSHSGFSTAISTQTKRDALKNSIVGYLNNANYPNLSKFTGIELDFEHPTGGWSTTNWTNYTSFINSLGSALNNIHKQLMITLPTGLGSKLSFFKDNDSVNFITFMCYDDYVNFTDTSSISNDFGPLSPNNFVLNSINAAKTYIVNNSNNPIGNLNKIIIGMPSYGYHAISSCVNPPCDTIDLKSYANCLIANFIGYKNAIRDTSSFEMKFRKDNNSDSSICYYQDALGMSEKVEFIRSQGIKHVSVWHLGGNDWFNKFTDTSYKQVTAVLDSTLWKNASKALNYSIIHDTTCAYPSSLNVNNKIIFKGSNNYSNALFKGMEVAIIGHAENDTNLCSTISVEFSNDGVSWTTSNSISNGVKIYSNHDIIKIIGSNTDNWNLINSPFSTYQIRIKYLGGAVPHINGVFVKMYFGSPGQIGSITNTYQVKASTDDARCIDSDGSCYNYDVSGQPIGNHYGLNCHSITTYTSYLSGLRFQHVNIPRGSIINSAYLELYNLGNVTNNGIFQWMITGEANSSTFYTPDLNSSNFTTPNTPCSITHSTPSLITGSNTYTCDPSSSEWTTIGWVQNINVQPIIDTLINLSNWQNDSALSLFIKGYNETNNSSVKFATYETSSDHSTAAKLVITYQITENSICEYYNTPKYITADTTWDNDPSNPKVVLNDVIINPGVTLTITGAVEFTQQAKLIVKQGGVLIIDGGTLTNLCDNKTWQGIEVWGTSGKGQNSILNSPFQGMVQLINGAEIDNAEDAIRLWHPNDTATTGGIVIANNATFYNNRRSIDFEKYQNIIPGPTDTSNIGNLSQFVNCTFDIDDDYISANKFYCHASLWNVNGIFFQGCTFMNEQSDIQYSASNNKGIISLDAGYTINGYCDHSVLYGQSCPKELLTPCYFSGFNYAVHAMTSSTPNVVVVDESVFDQNVIGVEYDAVNNSWVNRLSY